MVVRSRAPMPERRAISISPIATPPSDRSWAAVSMPSRDPATRISAGTHFSVEVDLRRHPAQVALQVRPLRAAELVGGAPQQVDELAVRAPRHGSAPIGVVEAPGHHHRRRVDGHVAGGGSRGLTLPPVTGVPSCRQPSARPRTASRNCRITAGVLRRAGKPRQLVARERDGAGGGHVAGGRPRRAPAGRRRGVKLAKRPVPSVLSATPRPVTSSNRTTPRPRAAPVLCFPRT